jgi:hypothetical protein
MSAWAIDPATPQTIKIIVNLNERISINHDWGRAQAVARMALHHLSYHVCSSGPESLQYSAPGLDD